MTEQVDTVEAARAFFFDWIADLTAGLGMSHEFMGTQGTFDRIIAAVRNQGEPSEAEVEAAAKKIARIINPDLAWHELSESQRQAALVIAAEALRAAREARNA